MEQNEVMESEEQMWATGDGGHREGLAERGTGLLRPKGKTRDLGETRV